MYNLQFLPVMLFLHPIELQRAPQPIAQRHPRPPAEPALDEAIVGVIVANIDCLTSGWERDDLEAARAVDFDQQFGQVEEIDRLIAAKVKDLPIGAALDCRDQ